MTKYTFLADGQKVSAVNGTGFGLEYVCSLVYKYVDGELQLESAGFGDGRIMVSESSNGNVYTPNYFITDHLGSTRAICDGSENIVRSDFLPYGTKWNNGQAATSRYQFTSYEDQELLDRKYMNAGVRFYNGWIFNTPDQLARNYPWISPYAYCLNNPINAFDPDGRLVIFINGMHGGSGGKAAYWNGFDEAVKKHLNDCNTRYYDGSTGGVKGLLMKSLLGPTFSNLDPNFRYNAGYNKGMKDASSILDQLSEGEKIKIITHSMGAAYAKGLIQALIDMGVDPSLFDFEADFAPYQPTKQKAVGGINTFQFTNFNDDIASNAFLLSPFGKIEGASVFNVNYDSDKGHSLKDFIQQINNLPPGKYRIENGKIVPY